MSVATEISYHYVSTQIARMKDKLRDMNNQLDSFQETINEILKAHDKMLKTKEKEGSLK